MDKAPEAFRTISEVAEALQTPAHVLRFWESKFTQVRPVKRAGGRRYYRPTDMDLLYGIRSLLHDQGMTIRGVQKMLQEHGVGHVAAIGRSTQPEGAINGTVGDVSARRPNRGAPIAGQDDATDTDAMGTQTLRDRAAGRSDTGAPQHHVRPPLSPAAAADAESTTAPKSSDQAPPAQTPPDETARPQASGLPVDAPGDMGADANGETADAPVASGADAAAPEGPPLADNIVDLRRLAPVRGDDSSGRGAGGGTPGPVEAPRPATSDRAQQGTPTARPGRPPGPPSAPAPPSAQRRPGTQDAAGGGTDETAHEDPAAAMAEGAAHSLAVRLREMQPQDLAPVRPEVVALTVRLDRQLELMAARSGMARP
ncbi:MerR family transcriptional regulator [Roseicitreum antarcticum]|uniref:MerR HTH family regulatory protein n=1 Tax=Roseicitreum antarcticum TaxID=564137 RepID=A0A1H3DCD8_9RHOB|nr:MerR family transcriptional regulator [Roseicitreum antarcticum]SDX63354.1 MerR HTH family regulatory protein [Roseicitreum antarcticum]